MVQQCHLLQVYTDIIREYKKYYSAAKEPKVLVTYRLINLLKQLPSLGQQNITIIYEYSLTLNI